MPVRIFEYAALYVGDKDSVPVIIIPTTAVVAKDERQVTMLAARQIPEEYLAKLDKVEIAVRPF